MFCHLWTSYHWKGWQWLASEVLPWAFTHVSRKGEWWERYRLSNGVQASMRSRKLGGCEIWATKSVKIDVSGNFKLPHACVKNRTDF
jgi:hypothetical protein